MTVIARRFRATPVRTGSEVWQAIVDLISSANSQARTELEDVAGIAASIIVDQLPMTRPITLVGSGPRLRIYCIYGEDAIEGDDANEDSLSRIPTQEEWKLYLPANDNELASLQKLVTQVSTRIQVYGPTDELSSDSQNEKSRDFVVDRKVFKKL